MTGAGMEWYMVELAAADWRGAMEWYVRFFNTEPILRHEADGFALFAGRFGRVALKRSPQSKSPANSAALVFRVDSLEAEVARLAAAGIAIDGELKLSPEGYRRALISGPEGARLCLFEWLTNAPTPVLA